MGRVQHAILDATHYETPIQNPVLTICALEITFHIQSEGYTGRADYSNVAFDSGELSSFKPLL